MSEHKTTRAERDSGTVPALVRFSIGDPVQKYYGGALGWSDVLFIRRGDGDRVELAQERWPCSHFSYATVSEIRQAAFTAAMSSDCEIYRQAAIRANNWINKSNSGVTGPTAAPAGGYGGRSCSALSQPASKGET
jgi:hypothetical protein